MRLCFILKCGVCPSDSHADTCIAKEGRIPPKLPYLNKTFANDTKINVDLDIDIDFNNIQVVDEDGTPITNYQDVIVAITDQPDVLKINATTISLSSSTRLATASPIADMLSIEVPPSTTRKASASTTFISKTLGESLLIQTFSDDVRADMISLTGTRTTVSLSTSMPTVTATWNDGDPITGAPYETPDDPLTSSSLLGSDADTCSVQAQQDPQNIESQAAVANVSLATSIAQPSTFRTVRTTSIKIKNATATVTKTVTFSASASANAPGRNSASNLSVEQDVAVEPGNKSGSDETTEADHIKIQIVQPCVKVICDSGTCLDPIECDESGVDA